MSLHPQLTNIQRSCRSAAFLLPAAALAVGFLVSGTPAQAQLTINPTYDDASFLAAGFNPTEIHNAVNYVAQEYSTRFSDPIHINIDVKTMNIGLGASNTFYYLDKTYATVRTALINDNAAHPSADGTTSVASLGVVDPTPAGSEFVLAKAQRKALGLAPDDLTTDGTFLFSTTADYTFDPNNRQVPGKFDFIGIAEHEISEIMGRAGFAGSTEFGDPSYSANDLFRYSGAGAPMLNHVHGGYFSIDGGVTNLTAFNDDSFGDLFDYRGDLATDPFNFNGHVGQGYTLSSVGITNLDVIGYDLRPSAVPEPGAVSLLGAGLMTLGGLCLRRLKQHRK